MIQWQSLIVIELKQAEADPLRRNHPICEMGYTFHRPSPFARSWRVLRPQPVPYHLGWRACTGKSIRHPSKGHQYTIIGLENLLGLHLRL